VIQKNFGLEGQKGERKLIRTKRRGKRGSLKQKEHTPAMIKPKQVHKLTRRKIPLKILLVVDTSHRSAIITLQAAST
jgi:hypothetical protein